MALAALFVACSPPSTDRRTKVTGATDDDITWDYSQSETAIAVSNRRVVIAFNDNTDPDGFLTYPTPSSRLIKSGASLAGWAWTDDFGYSWTYGGKLSPPPGIAVIWSDPAIRALRGANKSIVLLSNVAAKSDGFPSAGTPILAHLITGATIARSFDEGQTFNHWAYLTDNDHFYDGGSMTAISESSIAVAYNDTDSLSAAIWTLNALEDTPAPVLLPNPFPNLNVMGHVLVRSDQRGDLYAMAATQAPDGQLGVSVAAYRSHSWAGPISITGVDITGDLNSVVTAEANPATGAYKIGQLRTARNYDFDVGYNGVLGPSGGFSEEELRILVVANQPGGKRVFGIKCSTDLNHCSQVNNWASLGNGDHIRPRIVYAGLRTDIAPNNPLVIPQWKATYDVRTPGVGGDDFVIYQGNLNALGWLPTPLSAPRKLCPDERGYWGDYDEFVSLGAGDIGAPIDFLHAFSDSSNGCEYRDQYDSHHLHVSALRFQ